MLKKIYNLSIVITTLLYSLPMMSQSTEKEASTRAFQIFGGYGYGSIIGANEGAGTVPFGFNFSFDKNNRCYLQAQAQIGPSLVSGSLLFGYGIIRNLYGFNTDIMAGYSSASYLFDSSSKTFHGGTLKSMVSYKFTKDVNLGLELSTRIFEPEISYSIRFIITLYIYRKPKE